MPESEQELENKINDALGIEPEESELEENDEQESEEVVEAPEAPTIDDWKAKQEETARNTGWTDFDEWVSAGNDPDRWVTAEMFNVRGDFIGQMRAQERKHEQDVAERVAGVKKLHDAKIKELEAQRKEFIKEGDLDAVEAIEEQIGDLSNTEVQQPRIQQDVKAEEEWNARNTWINEESPKSLYARNQYVKYLQAGMDTAMALGKVDADIAREFAPAKPQGKPPASERGGGNKGFSRNKGPAQVTMADLTLDERQLWKSAGEVIFGGDEAKFLKAVADERAAG
jgi:hypothetical protein